MLETGMQIGKYELGRKLGEGGFGLVFVARDSGLDREVALKLLHPQHTANAEIFKRFLQEARSAAKIVHPGIVTVFEHGQAADGTAYIAMELLHGESLTDRLARSGRLDPHGAMEICRQIASALEAAHRAGIVHRDLKPDNIFLVADPAVPSGERVKVLDFGIAKLAQAATKSVHTHSMMVFGTPRYMSPEQCKSAAHIDHRSDIYALGVILFELVCGQPPFDGEPGELIAKHQLVPPPTAGSIIDELPPGLDDLISEMLAKAPGERPQTMELVQRTLEAGGALAPGLAATMMPDDFAAASLPRFTPPNSFGAVRRASSPAMVAVSEPPSRSTGPRRAVGNPTTLSAAASQVALHTASNKLPYIALGISVALTGAAVAVYFATRKPDAPTPVAQPVTAPVAAPDYTRPPVAGEPPPASAIALPSGASYVVTRVGAGVPPHRWDTVTIASSGWDAAGHARPAKRETQTMFQRTWNDLYDLMTPGERVRMWTGGNVFDVELVDVTRQHEPPATPPDVAAPPAGATRTGAGVAIEILQRGSGAHPHKADQVRVMYSGWTTDGTLFDSSVVRGEPVTVTLDAKFPGFTDALQHLAVGDRARLWIPPALAFHGAPTGALVVEVELLDVIPAKPTATVVKKPDVVKPVEVKPPVGPKPPCSVGDKLADPFDPNPCTK